MKIIWKFSTHAKINDSNGLSITWKSDRELENNIMTLLQSDPNVNERFLAQHFYNNLNSSPLALKHMSAYVRFVVSKITVTSPYIY